MDRRELLKIIALFTGAAMVGGELILSGCKSDNPRPVPFTPDILALLNEVGETIIPETDSPGAKDARVSEVMKTVVTACYWPEQQKAFMEGIHQIDVESNARFGKKFVEVTPQQRKELLIALEEEAKKYNEEQNKKDEPRREALKKQDKDFDFIASPKHYYTMMKQLTLLAYFSSEEGLTKALNYIPVPGRYDGAYRIKKGDKAFSG